MRKKKNIYLGMRPGDLDGKPYAAFWQPNMAPMQPQIVNAILHGEEARDLAFDLDDVGQLLKPGYLALENGYATLASGRIFVAALTHMPRVSGAMFEWWMGWHYMEDQRYKLWHPRAHMANGTRKMQGDDPSLSDREKYMTSHYVTEFIGNSLQKITITFFDPSDLFGNTADLTAGGTSALVCGRVDLQGAPITVGYLIHQIRETEDGAEMRSRFWVGKPEVRGNRKNGIRNRILGSRFVRRRAVSTALGSEMLVHCGMEMNHLAGFLPDLYAVYHPEHT